MRQGIGKDSPYASRYMSHDTLQYDAYCDILQYSTEFTENVKTADKHAGVYNLGSPITSHCMDIPADKSSQNNLIQNFLSNLFERYWQITTHTDVAAITSKWEMKFKCTLAL